MFKKEAIYLFIQKGSCLFFYLTIIFISLAYYNIADDKLNGRMRARDLGISIGIFPTGKYNAITDVNGVKVGHITLIEDDDVRTGVTAILPHEGNIFKEKVPAAVYVANGFGKLIGISQINELGTIETPIILTNTLSVWVAADAVAEYMLSLKGNEEVYSINPVVGETNDSYLNNIRKRSIKKEHVIEAIKKAKSGKVEEGNVGAGTGTVCFGLKGGIGTSSRVIPAKFGAYTIGVLVQTNYSGLLNINSVPIWKLLPDYPFKKDIDAPGSCMIVVATDAPLSHHNLYRLAKRAVLALGKTGSFMSNGSGDYVIAFSTNPELRVYADKSEIGVSKDNIPEKSLNAIFEAAVEATEEAIINSLTMASSMKGYQNHSVNAIDLELLKKQMAPK
jgi:D-aminopeptidase